MIFKYLLIIVYVFTVLMLSSCYENNIIELGKPELKELSSSIVFRGDNLTIYGINLREFPDSAAIYIDSNKVADWKSKNISKWNNSFITITTDTNFKSGKLYLIINKDTTNSLQITIDTMLNIQMITVLPVKDFEMGSLLGAEDETPIHKIDLTKKLEVSVFEVTQKLWQFVMKNNPSDLKSDSLPVVNIEWKDAIEFCNKYSVMRNLIPCYSKDSTGKWNWDIDSGGYRLPTEAEWEYFARANSKDEYSGSNDLNEIGWYELNSGFNIHKVGLKKKNSFGLYDVHGNAREWCWDYYGSGYYSNPENKIDPRGPNSGSSHVTRGGGSSDAARFLRLSTRTSKDTLITYQGFRIVRTIK